MIRIPEKAKRPLGWMFFIIGILLSPLVLLLPIYILGSAMIFDTGFAIENQLNEPVIVTPIGTAFQNNDKKTLMPLHHSATGWPAIIPRTWVGNFHLEPGERINLCYDTDDVLWSEMAVLTSDGLKMAVISRKGSYSGFVAQIAPQFLAPASPEIKALATKSAWNPTALLLLGGFLSPLLIASGFSLTPSPKRAERRERDRLKTAL